MVIHILFQEMFLGVPTQNKCNTRNKSDTHKRYNKYYLNTAHWFKHFSQKLILIKFAEELLRLFWI